MVDTLEEEEDTQGILDMMDEQQIQQLESWEQQQST